jgi:hypothetical protein
MDIAAHPPEAREAQIISLDQVRARRLPVLYVAPADPRPRQAAQLPQEKIILGGDEWLIDSILAAAENLMARLQRTRRPLEKDERARVMRASAALRTQPEGP